MSKGSRHDLLVEAANPAELRSWAAAIASPERNAKGEYDSNAKECFVLARWIAGSSFEISEIGFPSKLWKVEEPSHPDFVIETAARLVGIEVTEVTSSLFERAQKLAWLQNVEDYQLLVPGELPDSVSSDDLAGHIARTNAAPVYGHAPEQELVKLVRNRLCAKGAVAKSYPQFDDLILLLWDDAYPTNLVHPRASSFRKEMTADRRRLASEFSHVLLLSDCLHVEL